MVKRLLSLFFLIAFSVGLRAQEYRLRTEGFIMPDFSTPVTIIAEVGNGIGYKQLKSYSLSSSAAQPASSGRKNFMFYLNPESVYYNKGNIPFNLIVDGKTIPLTLQVPIIRDIQFNVYTDSIKPILNYYVNVEGRLTNGSIYPLDSSFIQLTSDFGTVRGMEWIAPKQRNFDKVTFTATFRYNPDISKTATVYLKKEIDPRDALDYQDRTEEEVIKGYRKK